MAGPILQFPPKIKYIEKKYIYNFSNGNRLRDFDNYEDTNHSRMACCEGLKTGNRESSQKKKLKIELKILIKSFYLGHI